MSVFRDLHSAQQIYFPCSYQSNTVLNSLNAFKLKSLDLTVVQNLLSIVDSYVTGQKIP
jgi:hypothetical protein